MRFNIKRLGEFPLNLGDTVSKTTSTPVLPVLSGQVAGWSIHENYAANLFQDSAKTTLAASDGDVLGGVTPLTGAVDASQTTTAAKPLLQTNGINGRWAARFDGGDDTLAFANIGSPVGAISFYVVANPVNSTSSSAETFLSSGGGILQIRHLTNTIGQTGWYDGAYKNAGAAAGGNQILSFVLGSGSGSVFRNGVSIGTDSYTDRGVSSGYIGSNSNISSYFEGLIGEVHIYDAEHSTSERQQMEAYLSSLWGISLA